MRQAITIFLRDRVHYTVAYILNTFLILLVFYLIHPQWVIDQFLYVLLLSMSVYISLLTLAFFRWYPMIKLLKKKCSQNHLDAFSSVDQRGTIEQQFYVEVLNQLYQSFFNEKQKIVQSHQQHQKFIELWVHQMKLPVSTLSLTMQQTQPQTVEEREQSHRLMEEIEKLNEGLNMAMSMARLTDFSIDYHLRPVSILKQVQEVIETRKNTMIRTSIFPQLIAEEKDEVIVTDPKWHRFILDQVVQNALKYTHHVKKQGKIKFILRKAGKQIHLSIQDEGPGIPKEDLPRLFDPFFTGDNGREYSEATGMGLYLVKKVCDQLNHQVSVTSTVGKGTTVTFTYKT